MSFIIGIFDRLHQFDTIIDDLNDNYAVKPDDIRLIVDQGYLDQHKPHAKRHAPHIQPYTTEKFLEFLSQRGVPEPDAMLFSQGLTSGKELLAVETTSTKAPAIMAYLKSEAAIETATTKDMPVPHHLSDTSHLLPLYKEHHQKVFNTQIVSFEMIKPAYMHGERWAKIEEMKSLSYTQAQNQMQQHWEHMTHDTLHSWENIEHAARYAWDCVKATVGS